MSSRAFAQRRQIDRHHVQPIVQIVAEAAGLDLVFQELVGGGDDPAYRRWMVRLSPTRSNSCSCRTRSSLTCSLGLMLEISSRKMRAAVGRLEAAGLVVDRPGEGPLDVAEQFAFQQAFAQGAAVDADIGAVGRRLSLCTARAMTSLPVPVSPTSRTLAVVGPPGGSGDRLPASPGFRR